jgi:hypothetical protein
MAYNRKTVDEFTVQGQYSDGWEDLTSEKSRKEILARLKEYRENEPGISFRYVKRRVKPATNGQG